eukprot:7291504-Pyramimonas_sp.AAC.1
MTRLAHPRSPQKLEMRHHPPRATVKHARRDVQSVCRCLAWAQGGSDLGPVLMAGRSDEQKLAGPGAAQDPARPFGACA